MLPDLFKHLVSKLTPNPYEALRTREPDGRELLHYNGTAYELMREEPIRFAMLGVPLATARPGQ